MTDYTNAPNYDHAAEVALLSVALTSPTARAEAKRHLVGADFYDPRHEIVWNAMLRLERHGKAVDPVAILAITKSERGITEALPNIVTAVGIPEHTAEYASIIRSWSTKRQLATTAQSVWRQALNPDANAVGYAASVVNQFAAIRDGGITDEDDGTRTFAEVMAEADAEPDWLIPGLLERRDRMMLTGEEGLGKSHLLRQFAISAAAGIDPWSAQPAFDPVKVMLFDCENSEPQVRRQSRQMVQFAERYGRADVTERVFLNCSSRIDITRDKDLARIHRSLDLWQPELMVIGPLYRLIPRAIQTDDDAAPVLAALDTIRDRGLALLIEAHAGHAIGKGNVRDLRPRGSSALLGWPEFGYGMRDLGAQGKRYAQFVAWRGDRSERKWPAALRRTDDGRWIEYEGGMTSEAWSA